MNPLDHFRSALADRYAIDREIGAGGMATVYLARDVRHNRQVALKVLNPELGAVLGSERFMSEIEVTANLHHPNLLPLFDSGEAGGLLFYVMPFVEGETLRARLNRERQLGVDEAVRIATAVASALDYAHRHDVIHRDLKPENILMHEGQPLVMDFGIALAVSKAGGARITQTGLSLGTPQYMSPEQATGDHVLDQRTDIYSLGAVLYEMLVGDPPHTGSTVAAVIAKVITEHPGSVRATRPNVPEHIEAAVMTALAKIPADRFATGSDLAAALSGQRPVSLPTPGVRAAGGTSVGALTLFRPEVRELVAWTIAALALFAAGMLAMRPEPPRPAPMVAAIEMPDSVDAITSNLNWSPSVAISRDGSAMVFVGTGANRTRPLYTLRLGDVASRRVAGTEDAAFPTFSPDGRWLAFTRALRLYKVAADGGTPQPIADSASFVTWNDDGFIYFVRNVAIWRVSEDGGEPQKVFEADTTRVFALATLDALPGGRDLLATIRTPRGTFRIVVVSLADAKIHDIGFEGRSARYVEPGYLTYMSEAGRLMAIRFSASRRAVTGAPIRIADNVETLSNATADYTIARHTGHLVFRWYRRYELAPTELLITDRNGRTIRRIRAEPRHYDQPRLSPDGRNLAVRVDGRVFNSGDIWVIEVASGAAQRLTSGGSNYRASWSRDGTRLYYMRGNPDSTLIVSRAWDGSGAESVHVRQPSMAEFLEGPRGGWSVMRTLGGRDIMIVPADSLGQARFRPFEVSPTNESDLALSPNGRLLAYSSDETGRFEIYLRRIPGPGRRVTVSLEGGIYSAWSHDGSTLFYQSGGVLMAARVAEQPELAVTTRDTLFAFPADDAANSINYAPGRDGGFVIASGPRISNPLRTAILVNWQSLFAKP